MIRPTRFPLTFRHFAIYCLIPSPLMPGRTSLQIATARILQGGIVALLTLSQCFLVSCSFPAAALEDGADVRTVRPGVVYRFIRDSRGPWQIHVVEADLRAQGLYVETVHARDSVYGLEETSSMAKRIDRPGARVVAAMNADFFEKTGETVNNQVQSGTIIRALVPVYAADGEYRGIRSQVGFLRDGHPFIERCVFEGEILCRGGGRAAITGVNVVRSRTDLVLFNHYAGIVAFGDSSHGSLSAYRFRSLGRAADTVIAYLSARVLMPDSVRIPAEDLVLASFRSTHLFDSLGVTVGDTVRFVLRFRPSPGPIRSLAGGIPRLVKDGESMVGTSGFLEGASEEFSSKRHPRSGIGFSADSTRVFFIVVDGRQRFSAGMTLPEFADLMIRLGVAQGLNLDGGGSSTLVVDQAVVNSPSDPSGERPVGNAMVLVGPDWTGGGAHGE